MQNKNIPHDPELEAIVLGGMLLESRGVVEFIEVVKDTNVFFSQKNALIYDAILSLYKASKSIDLMTVRAELKQIGKLKEAGVTLWHSQKGYPLQRTYRTTPYFLCSFMLRERVSR